MRVLVTGAGGFVGSHLTRALLQRGDEVIPVGRTDTAGCVPIARVLAEPERFAVDVVLHAAAVRHRHGVGATEYRASNIGLVTDLVTALRGRFRRLVHVSSVGVYGFPSALPITEATPYAPRTLYSATKVHAERAVRELARMHGFELVIARPTITYGPGDRNGMLDKLAAMVEARRYLLVGDGQNSLHHTYVSDLVAGLLLAVSHPAAAGEDFIFCGPEPTTLRALSKLVAAELGVALPPVHIPLPFARAVATAVDIAAYRGLAWDATEPPINHDKLDVMTVPIAFSSAKAQRVLGFAPSVPYAEGVQRTLAARAR